MADKTIIAAGAAEIDDINDMLARYRELFPLLDTAVVAGGAERTDSVKNALALTGSRGFIAVHDGARPFAGKEVFERTLKAAVKYGAAIAAVPVKNTIKLIDENGFVAGTPQRSLLRAVQTPQIFDADLLRGALQNALEKQLPVTDDCSAVEAIGMTVQLTEGSEENIKLTTPLDLELAEAILRRRERA